PRSVPAVVSISVRPTTTAPPPTAAVTTEEPPPPPPVEPPPTTRPTTTPPPTTTTAPTTERPDVALRGFPCEQEGATAVDPAGRPLVCEQNRRGRLHWDRP
ncbi:hypothetical protein J7S33_16815, partial [Saccharothrix algeriensis]